MSKRIAQIVDGKVTLRTYNTKKSQQYYRDLFGNDIVFVEGFPDGIYQDAWELSGSTINVNMALAKEIHRNKLRAERDQHLSGVCDRLYIEAISSKKDTSSIKARQQYLRDMPENPLIDSATTVEELKAVTIDESWVPPEVKTLDDDVKLHVKDNEPESSTTSKIFKRKSRLTFNSVATKYLITFSAEVKNTNKRGNCRISVLLDDVEINRTTRKADPFELDYNIVSGSIIRTLTEGEHNLDLNYATSKGVCFIRRVRLQAMKIET